MLTKITQSILNDDLQAADSLLRQKPEGYQLAHSLLKMVMGRRPPLEKLKANLPKVINISTSFTCPLKCEMCSAGFHNKRSLFADRKYLTLEEFNQMLPWMEKGTSINFCGEGESLESPLIFDFLKKTRKKLTVVITSGINLDIEKIKFLIKSDLDILHFSFDGRTSVGHGGGKEKYIQNFWQRIRNIQKIKKELNSNSPAIGLQVTVNGENVDNLDEIFSTALQHQVYDIALIPMIVHSETLFQKSIHTNYEGAKKKINKAISKWNKKGMDISFMVQHKTVRDSVSPCFFVDNYIDFHTEVNLPSICCSSLRMPLEISHYPVTKYWNSFPFRYFRFLHFHSELSMLPMTCQTCWIANLKRYSKTCRDSLSGSPNQEAYPLYLEASSLKNRNKLEESQRLFAKVLDLKPESSLVGKSFFHLGEIKLKEKNYPAAFSSMKSAVQHCFDHKMAFIYLYLLWMLLEEGRPAKKRNKASYKWLQNFTKKK